MALRTGMTPEAVMRAIGQPNSRTSATFEFCVVADRTGTVSFSPDGRLTGVSVIKAPPPGD